MLYIYSDPIGTGGSRKAYIHPIDHSKCVKVFDGRKCIQSKREIAYYRQLEKRKNFSWLHVPRFFGKVPTNKGPGMVVELVKDYDGKISRSLSHYLSDGCGIDRFRSELHQLKEYLLKYSIIFNYDMSQDNLLYQRLDRKEARLMIIDGLGDIVFIPLLNRLKGHVRKKILRRWGRFEGELRKHDSRSQPSSGP